MSHAQAAGAGSESDAQTTFPSGEALQHAAQKAEETDCPIRMDYWRDSLEGKAMVGLKSDGSKLLVKSAAEYTSLIDRILRVGDCYIVMTENTIYPVHAGISSVNISE
jgi:hypothetical protein